MGEAKRRQAAVIASLGHDPWRGAACELVDACDAYWNEMPPRKKMVDGRVITIPASPGFGAAVKRMGLAWTTVRTMRRMVS